MTFWESDGRTVPLKREDQSRGPNRGNARAGKADQPAVGARANTRSRPGTDRTQRRPIGAQYLVCDGWRLHLITTRAEGDPAATFNNLDTLRNHDLLWHAFRKLKRDKAPGVDGETVDQYEENLQGNLQDLETRLHRQSYRPQPSLRRDIPKGNGKTRPPTNAARRCPIACVEDKIVQRAVVMILERIYEVDFCDTS